MDNPNRTVLIGDTRDILPTLPEKSFHCCVTSPPFYGLRDYGTAEWEGGDAGCDHIERAPGRGSSTLTSAGIGQTDEGQAYKAQKRQFLDTCRKCGARRIDRQIGLEPTPDEYVAEMVKVFSLVKRVLRDDGTVFLNLGDSYAGGGGHSPDAPSSTTSKSGLYGEALKSGGIKPQGNIKAKDLIGIPWAVAFALRADGWYLRQEIIWAKPNPMPESVTDRCTKSHEQIFLLSKLPRYYFDAKAIAEPAVGGVTGGFGDAYESARRLAISGGKSSDVKGQSWDTRNRRSVWTVTTQPFSQAHFATFPPKLIEPCILAGCPAQCCGECGAPYERQTEKTDAVQRPPSGTYSEDSGRNDGNRHPSGGWVSPSTTMLGFAPTCDCDAPAIPGRVLDPFGGAGTTGLVADRLQRRSTMIELNPAYAAMAQERIDDDAPLLGLIDLPEPQQLDMLEGGEHG